MLSGCPQSRCPLRCCLADPVRMSKGTSWWSEPVQTPLHTSPLQSSSKLPGHPGPVPSHIQHQIYQQVVWDPPTKEIRDPAVSQVLTKPPSSPTGVGAASLLGSWLPLLPLLVIFTKWPEEDHLNVAQWSGACPACERLWIWSPVMQKEKGK